MNTVSSRAAALRRRISAGDFPRTATPVLPVKATEMAAGRVPARVTAEQHREATLLLLARLGYGTARQVARAVWCKADASSRVSAGRTLRWLLSKNLITRRRDGGTASCEYLYALTRSGVQWLNGLDGYLPGGRPHARDWLRYAHPHRTACNDVASSLLGQKALVAGGLTVYSELEIRSGIVPISKLEYAAAGGTRFAKIPDLLITGPRGVGWVEVENAYRNERDFQKMLAMMRAEALSKEPRVNQFIFYICARGAARIGARFQNALAFDLTAPPGSIAAADTKIQREMLFVFELDRESLQEKRVMTK
jgi:hypothetical protein